MNKSLIILTATLSAISYAAQQFEGKQYAAHSVPQYGWAQDMIQKIEPWPQKGALLDVGCGDGRITKDLQKRIPDCRVVGLDKSPSMLEQAASEQTPSISWIEESAEKMNFTEEFDVVTSFSTLHWVKEIKTALDNVHRALKPGGKGYFVLGAKDNRKMLQTAVLTLVASEKWKSYFEGKDYYKSEDHTYTPKEMTTMLTETQFKVLECETQEKHHLFADKEAFYLYLESASPYKKLLQEKHREFGMDVIEMYSTLLTSGEGPLDYITYQLYVIVEKPA